MSLTGEELERIYLIQAKHNRDHAYGMGCPTDCDIAFLLALAFRLYPPMRVPGSWKTE
jgi:hypothetical protein